MPSKTVKSLMRKTERQSLTYNLCCTRGIVARSNLTRLFECGDVRMCQVAKHRFLNLTTIYLDQQKDSDGSQSAAV